ncbi:MAG TPA: hypothetical protein VGX68_14605 [Thermoanaerobaculia bacterium]|jgi:hypothetical protein|nr:hypothetical protein [Thermoanaerobaculia bacterium]
MNPLRRAGRLLVVLALLPTAAASAGPRLLAPQAGAELRAGSLAAVAWEDPPAGAEEWEAFLSLDGGRTYPLRITPHLDLGLRRFTFQVPPLPTHEARLLLRFGDERREVEFEAAQRFAITPGVASWPAGMGIALSRGERPRPLDSGVVVWTEGGRDGGGLREVAAEQEETSFRTVETARLPWIPLVWPPRHRAGLTAPSVPSRTAWTPLSAWLETELRSSPLARPSARLLTGRLNE